MLATVVPVSRLEDLIERDGPACVWCGREMWRRDLTLEHILPRSRGGHTVPENLVVACRSCNRARGSRPVIVYVRALHDAGASPRTTVLARALERLAGSARLAHARYGERQGELLARALSPGAGAHADGARAG